MKNNIKTESSKGLREPKPLAQKLIIDDVEYDLSNFNVVAERTLPDGVQEMIDKTLAQIYHKFPVPYTSAAVKNERQIREEYETARRAAAEFMQSLQPLIERSSTFTIKLIPKK